MYRFSPCEAAQWPKRPAGFSFFAFGIFTSLSARVCAIRYVEEQYASLSLPEYLGAIGAGAWAAIGSAAAWCALSVGVGLVGSGRLLGFRNLQLNFVFMFNAIVLASSLWLVGQSGSLLTVLRPIDVRDRRRRRVHVSLHART